MALLNDKIPRASVKNFQKEVIFRSIVQVIAHEMKKKKKEENEAGRRNEREENEEEEYEGSRLSHLRRIVCNVEDATVRAKRSHSRCHSPTCDASAGFYR